MRYERVWVCSAHKLGSVPILFVGSFAVCTEGGLIGLGIFIAGIALGALGLRPIRIAVSPSSETVALSAVLSRRRTEVPRHGERLLVYSHRGGFLRGTANLARVVGSQIEWVPATNGTMFWKHPELPAAPPPRAFRICGTRTFLALIVARTGGPIDLTGALRMGT